MMSLNVQHDDDDDACSGVDDRRCRPECVVDALDDQEATWSAVVRPRQRSRTTSR